MDTRGSPELFPGPTDGSVESLFRLIPSPEGQQKLWQILELLHPADARTFVKNLLRMSPAPALQTQPEPLRRGCDTDVAASVESLFRLIPSPEEQRELCRSDYILQMPGLSWKICFSMTSNTPTILTMMAMMNCIVVLMCVVVLTQLIMHRLIWNLCMNCMDQITVGPIVSCGMRSDRMDIVHNGR